MENISLSEKALNILLKRKHACCFVYCEQDNHISFEGNFNYEIFTIDDNNDLIHAFLTSKFVLDRDKIQLAEFYAQYKANLGKKSDFVYHEQLLHINFNKDSNYIPVSFAVGFDINSDGIVIGYIGYIVSIANAAEQIRKDANESNKKAPFNIEQAAKIVYTSEKSAIIQFDIRNFKHINQRYGEKFGDKILKYITENIESAWGRKIVSARLGADIFIIFTEYEDQNELERRIEQVKTRLQTYTDVSYKFYFGVYIVTDKTLELRKMTDHAATARKIGRENALNSISYYTSVLAEKINLKHQIEREMEHALATGQFKLYLQPKVRISNNRIIGAEALVRWVHPEKGIISPADFIPVFEQNGFIANLDSYMHRQVCALIRKWIDRGITPVNISANVSQVYLNPELPEKLKNIVDEYDIPVELFQIEITESFKNRQVETAINEFKKQGFTLLMDDFGSGYSSLNTLSTTNFDVIKLDRGFLSSYTLNERCKKIVTHTISMVNDIGLGLVAEGVETKEQADFLDSNGCNCAQGFLYSRPVPVEEFEKMLFSEKISV